MKRARSGMWFLSLFVIENPINLKEKTTNELWGPNCPIYTMHFSSCKNDGVGIKVWREKETENRKREVECFYLLPQKVCLLFSPFTENYKSTVLSFVEIMAVVEQAMFFMGFCSF